MNTNNDTAAVADGPLKVAYFINQYPKVSHTFIRREIAALERLGVAVERIALRGWDAEVTDAEDVAERGRTHYVLRAGVARLAGRALLDGLASPWRFARALRLAWSTSRRSERPFPYHVVYLLEAAQVARWMRGWGVTHVHAHFGTNSAEVAMLARALSGSSYSFTAHGPEEFDKPEALGLGRKVSEAAFTVAISSFGRSQLSRWIPADRWPRIQVVHCGLEESFFAGADELRPASVQRLVCVGRLCEQKGQLLLVAAAGALARQGVAFELVLAGDGEMRGVIEREIAAHGLQSQVRITGWISSQQVREELLAARALVLPSFAEGLPVVIMEAMAIGRPVISTYIAGIPELVRDGVDGWLVPAGDVDALVVAMRDCLAADPQRLRAMGGAAHARVRERHHVDVEAGKLMRLFHAAARGGRMMGALAIGLCLTAGLLSATLILAVGVFALQIVAASLRGVPGAVVAASVPRGPLAVLVPAHDEESGIGATVAGLRAQLAPGDRLLVVADNCTDATAAVALSAGAEVVERTSELRGKGYALGFGMAHLALAPPQAVVIVDADCQLAPGALEVLVATMNRSGRPVQALYLMLAQEGAGLSRRIAAFAWRVRNQVRPAGWHRLGLPCQLMGTGMAFPWAMLHGAPIANGSIVEDMKLGIDLAVQGAAPVFCEAALVTSTFPDTAAATTTQRTRWEHGHLEMIFREVPAMVARSVLRADIRLFGLALDLAVPPLALLAGLLCADELLVVLAWTAGAPVRWLFAVSALPVVFALSVLVAWWTAGRDLVRFIELLSIPWYILAKIPLYVRFLVKRQKSWVRTDRK